MDIQVVGTRRSENQSMDPGFFERLALSNAENIFVSVAMPAEGKPFIKFAMVMEERLRTIRTYKHHASREVCREAGALKTLGSGFKEFQHPSPEHCLFGALGKIQRFKGGAKISTGHGRV
jgi:hypothetical protein